MKVTTTAMVGAATQGTHGEQRASVGPAPMSTIDEVAGALVRAAARVSQVQARALRTAQLSPSAYALLGALADAPGQTSEPRTLARRLEVTRPSVCGLIDGLEDKGLVARAPHHRDGRRVLVRLTAQGQRTLRGHADRYTAAVSSAFATIDDTDRHHLLTLLQQVGVRERAQGRAPAAHPE